MEAKETLRKIAALPPEAQAVIFDLLEAMEQRYSPKAANSKPRPQMKNLRSDPFVGMWRDREDMADAAQYVRTLRRAEWRRGSSSS